MGVVPPTGQPPATGQPGQPGQPPATGQPNMNAMMQQMMTLMGNNRAPPAVSYFKTMFYLLYFKTMLYSHVYVGN